jgi:hypothetical protein
LVAGDHIVEAGSRSKSTQVRGISGPTGQEDVYNLHTDGEHNFIVHGMVAHNFTFLRRTRMLLHRVILDQIELGKLLPNFGGEPTTL